MSSTPLPENPSIVYSTAFSIALHVAVAAAVLYSVEGMVAYGDRVEIDVVRVKVPGEQRQQATERSPTQTHKVADTGSRQPQRSAKGLSRPGVESPPPTAANETPQAVRETAVSPVRTVAAAPAETAQLSPDRSSRSESQQSASPLEDRVALIAQLLHDEISAHKRYPYLARRRGLSGISTVQFMLAPDGRISDTRVIQSSRYGLLDRAAMTAVNRIDPFVHASDYLDEPERFEINVVFNLH